jgi:hypothetical protein
LTIGCPERALSRTGRVFRSGTLSGIHLKKRGGTKIDVKNSREEMTKNVANEARKSVIFQRAVQRQLTIEVGAN